MDKALATQLANIEKRTGQSLDALAAVVRKSGLTKHSEIRDMLKRDFGMGHGDMCQYKVKLSEAAEVDAELVAWVRRAYDAAG
jgi:hypothetical protein